MRDRLVVLVIVVSALSSILCMYLFCLPQQSMPDLIVFPTAFQSIGPVRQMTETKAEYTLHNRASVPIQILDTMTSCTCAGIELPEKEIASGQTVPLTLRFNSGASRNSLAVRAIIVYRLNGEEKTHILRVGLQAEIDPDYSVEPERVEFGSGRPLVQRVILSPRHISALKIDSAVCNLRFFKAKIVPADKSNQQAVEVTFDPHEYYHDAGLAELLISTDSQCQPLLRVPLDVIDQNALANRETK